MEYLKKTDFDSSVLPDILRVTTMSITFKTGTNIFVDEVKQVYPNQKRSFYNSVSWKVPIDTNATREVHFKLFKNGTIQGAGFKTLNDINYAISHIINKLSEIVYIKVDDHIKEIKFTQNNILVSEVEIILINANFSFPFLIRRDIFFNLLLQDGITCFFDSCKHAAIKIHFNVRDKIKPIKIFVFQSGSVNIFGSKNHKHILGAYIFIKEFVDKHFNAIKAVKINLISI